MFETFGCFTMQLDTQVYLLAVQAAQTLILRYFYTYFYERRIISSLIVFYYILWPYGARELKVKFENAHL